MTKRFTEEQIVSFLFEADTGIPVRELCNKHGFSERSYYQWRSRIVGCSTSLAQRLTHLQRENEQLRQLLADAPLDAAPLRTAATFATTLASKDLCESLLRVHTAAQQVTGRLLGLRESEPLQWPELMPFLEPASSSDVGAESKVHGKAGLNCAMA